MKKYNLYQKIMHVSDEGVWLKRYDVSTTLNDIKSSVYNILAGEDIETEVNRVIDEINNLLDKLD